jgi:hypothetical protein
MIASCILCTDEERFKTPWDEIGVELMKAHMIEKHEVKVCRAMRRESSVPPIRDWSI